MVRLQLDHFLEIVVQLLSILAPLFISFLKFKLLPLNFLGVIFLFLLFIDVVHQLWLCISAAPLLARTNIPATDPHVVCSSRIHIVLSLQLLRMHFSLSNVFSYFDNVDVFNGVFTSRRIVEAIKVIYFLDQCNFGPCISDCVDGL